MTEKNYLAYRRTGGKTLFARIADEIILDLFFFLFSFLLVFSLGKTLKTSLITAFFLGFAFSIMQRAIKKEKQLRFTEKYRELLQERVRIDKFSLLEDNEKFQIIMESLKLDNPDLKEGGLFDRESSTLYFLFPQHRNEELNAFEIAELIIRKRRLKAEKCIAITASKLSFDAKNLAGMQKIDIMDLTEIINNTERIETSEEEIDEALRFETELYRERKKEERKAVFSKGSLFYAGCGIFFGIYPVLFGFSFLYPIMSAVCLLLAAIKHFSNNAKI